MTGETRTIYNASDGPIPRDRAGRMLGAGERVEVDNVEGLTGHIDAGRLIVIEDAVEAMRDEADTRKKAADKAKEGREDAAAVTARANPEAPTADDTAEAPADQKPKTTRTRKGASTQEA